MRISSASAYAVFDSRGTPTVAVRMAAAGCEVVGMSPSGASAGSHEAFEMRDGEGAFQGKHVTKALAAFNSLVANKVAEMDFADQQSFDQWLQVIDGTENFSVLGGNTAIAASIAFLRLQAAVSHQEVYQVIAQQFNFQINSNHAITPLVNVINGGKHASSGLSIQEVMIVPVAGSTTAEKIFIAAEIFNALKVVLKQKGVSTLVGDEGGFAPNISQLSQAVELVQLACEKTSYVWGRDIKLALDVAATELLQSDGTYLVDGKKMTVAELVAFYQEAVERFHLVSLEDPFGEDDFTAWELLAQAVGKKVQIVGDDLTVTNVTRMQLVEEKKLVSAMIVKPNQIGTISQTVASVQLAQKYGWNPILSHRSGETEDTTIADIAYAVNAPFIKTGSMSRTDRMAKYNRLIGIVQGAKSQE